MPHSVKHRHTVLPISGQWSGWRRGGGGPAGCFENHLVGAIKDIHCLGVADMVLNQYCHSLDKVTDTIHIIHRLTTWMSETSYLGQRQGFVDFA